MDQKLEEFEGGQLSKHQSQWEQVTSDKSILDIIKGDKMFFTTFPNAKHFAINAEFSKEESDFIKQEIDKYLKKKIIKPCQHEAEEYVSSIFTRPKPDGSIRMILNLKNLNKHVKFEHFKMSTIYSVLNMITKDCYMAKIDLKDAYYSVKIDEKHQKYLKFKFDKKLYKFTCFPNGLGPCPRKFTKITKVPMSNLRQKRVPVCGYIDDFLTKSQSYKSCLDNIMKIIEEFQYLGFVVHPNKSKFEPSQVITFLGFVLNSREMTVSLTTEKEKKLKHLITQLLSIRKPTIRFVAKVVGTLVSSFPAVKYAPLHYRHIEKVKSEALALNKGDFEAHCCLTPEAISDLTWWKSAILINWIHTPPITLELETDACTGDSSTNSSGGWGATCKGEKCGGAWNLEEQTFHINTRELLAIYYALRSFKRQCKDKHVRILCDNTAAIGIVNKMGSSKSMRCNEISKTIWQFCQNNGIWVTATYIPGILNVVADEESRREYKESEWQLNPSVFKSLKKYLSFEPEIDYFASRLNAQTLDYVSYKSDPYAKYVNAFALNWAQLKGYIFPPFSLIGRVLQKIQTDQATALVVVPNWTTQPWYTTFMEMLLTKPVMVGPSRDLLRLPQKPELLHPLHQKLSLMVGILSGESIMKKV